MVLLYITTISTTAATAINRFYFVLDTVPGILQYGLTLSSKKFFLIK